MLTWDIFAVEPARVWGARAEVVIGETRRAVALRIVERAEKFDVDLRASAMPWEQIENWRNPPRTFEEAKAFAEKWLAAANEQQTIFPKVPA